MTRIIHKKEIQTILTHIDPQVLLKKMEEGFIAYSEKKVVVPPVGHLQFPDRAADVHIKYGYIQNDDYYIVKVASSFYDNPAMNLPSSNGLILVFSQKTGELLTIFLDEGYLTDIRTALAGAVVARYLAPTNVHAIGIVGTGTQARLQLEYLRYVTACKKVFVWGRNKHNLHKYLIDMNKSGFSLTATENIEDITNYCNLIVTTTPSSHPLLYAKNIKRGTHITAMGADSIGKQELDPQIFQKADIVVADSKKQCIHHGDISHAIQEKLITEKEIIELGSFIKNKQKRENDTQITVADLTGVAIQDIQIAKVIEEYKD